MLSSTPSTEKKPKISVEMVSALKELSACARSGKYAIGSYDVKLIDRLQRRKLKSWTQVEIDSILTLVEHYSEMLKQRGVRLPDPGDAPAQRRAWLEDGIAMVVCDYHPEMAKSLQYITKSKFDWATKCWRIPVGLNTMESLINVLVNYCFSASPELIREFDMLGRVLDVVAEESRAQSVETPLLIPGLKCELLPYQQAGIRYLVERKRSFLADDMGLGKTVQSLGVVEYLSQWPVVVVCPPGLIFNWGKEIAKWLPDRSFTLLPADDIPEILPKTDFYVVGYDTLSKLVAALRLRKPKAIVFDEFHYLKERKTKRFIWSKKLVNRIDIRLGLTGTPIPNRPVELVGQLQMLGMLNTLGGLIYYYERYCDGKKYGTRIDVRGASNLEELNGKLRGHGFLRRLKKDVLKELPEKTRTYVPMGMGHPAGYLKAKERFNDIMHKLAESRRKFTETLKGLADDKKIQALELWLNSPEQKKLRGDVLASMGEMRRVAALGRFTSTVEFIRDAVADSEGKVIVFAHHKEMVARLREEFPDSVFLDESQKPSERQAMVDRFQDDPKIRMLISPIKIGYVGYNMTAASQVIFAEMDWVPSVHDQAEDRALRIGQKKNVSAWYLYASGTIEEKMIAILEGKRSIITRATDGSASGEESKTMLGELLIRLGADEGEEERYLVAGRLREYLSSNRKN